MSLLLACVIPVGDLCLLIYNKDLQYTWGYRCQSQFPTILYTGGYSNNPAIPPAPPRPQSYPQVLHIVTHRVRMLCISYTQVIHAAHCWHGYCIREVWVCMWIP